MKNILIVEDENLIRSSLKRLLERHQYKVSEGEELLVSLFSDKEELLVEPLLYVDEKKVEIGKPVLKTKVVIKKIGDEKGEKIEGMKYKSKSRYRKRFGFRPSYSRIKIEKISA